MKVCLCRVPPGGGGGGGGGRGGDCQRHPAKAAADDRGLQNGAKQAGHAVLRRAAGRRLQEELRHPLLHL